MYPLLLRASFSVFLAAVVGLFLAAFLADEPVQTESAPTWKLQALLDQSRGKMKRWRRAFAKSHGPPRRRLRQANRRTELHVYPCPLDRGQVVLRQSDEPAVLIQRPPKRRWRPFRRNRPGSFALRVPEPASPKGALCLHAGRIHPKFRPLVAISIFLFSLLMGLLVFIWPLVRRLRRIERAVSAIAEGDLDQPIEDQNDDPVGTLAEGLRQMTARLKALFEARKRFSDAASHELRTPLARLAAALDLLQQQPEPEPALLEGMRQDLAELNSLVDELLLLGRLEDPQRRGGTQPVDLLDLAKNRGAAAARGGGLEARLVETSSSAMVKGDKPLLARLLDNLITNAQRHGESQVTIRVELQGAEVLLSVEDDGPGVPADLVDRIFEPFVSGGGRSGLGLAIADEIARVHGGRLSYGPSALGGAAFSLQLPVGERDKSS